MKNKLRKISLILLGFVIAIMLKGVLSFGNLKNWLPMLPITQIIVSLTNPTPLFSINVTNKSIILNPNWTFVANRISGSSGNISIPNNACLIFNNTSCPFGWKYLTTLSSEAFSKIKGWAFTQWRYRRKIIIKENSGNNLTDYQVNIDLTQAFPWLNKGLILSLHFDEGSGTRAKDSSGYGNDGILVNGPQWVDGVEGKALKFDGKDDYVETSTPNPGEGAFTVCVWIKDPTHNGRLVSYDSNPNTVGIAGDWALSLGDPGTLNDIRFYYRGASTVNLDALNLRLTDGNWHFICGVRDPFVGIRKIYHNGKEVASLTGDTFTAPGSGTPIVIGGETSNSFEYPATSVGAIIDEVRIYNRALNETEIKQLFCIGAYRLSQKGEFVYPSWCDNYIKTSSYSLQDLRFTYKDPNTGNESIIPYWVENDKSVWVKVPYIPANGKVTVYMYYGNPSATSESNPYDVFDFYDNFNNWSGWTQYLYGIVSQNCSVFNFCTLKKDKYCDPSGGYKNLGFTLNYPFIFEARIYRSYLSGCNADRLGVIDDNGNGYGIEIGHYSSSLNEYGWDKRVNYGAIYTRFGYLTSDITYRWYRVKWYWDNGKMGFYILGDNGNVLAFRTATDYTYRSFTRVYVFGGYTYFVDWIRIRKYANPEPTIILGSEETRLSPVICCKA